MVARLSHTQEVIGSSPISATMKIKEKILQKILTSYYKSLFYFYFNEEVLIEFDNNIISQKFRLN